MNHKKVAKLGIVFALAMSILTNSVGNMFAQQEEQIEEVTIEDYKSEIKEKEEVREEKRDELVIPEEREDSLKTDVSLIEEKEDTVELEREATSYTLSRDKFRDIHLGRGEYTDNPIVKTIEFTAGPLPAEATSVDLSENEDGSVMGANVEGALIVTTNNPNEKVKFPCDSSYLFASVQEEDADGVTYFNMLYRDSIDLSNVDTSNVVTMKGMFGYIYNIESLDLSSFNTDSVTDMKYMFYSCSALTELDLSNFNTALVTDMSFMFIHCYRLATLNISNFQTSSVINMDNMFYNCNSLTSLDLSHFNVSNVRTMKSMFNNCSALTNLNLSNFNASSVENMSYMFADCSSLSTLNLNGFNTDSVTNMKHMFKGCTSLTALDLSSFNTSNVTDMYGMFYECEELRDLNLNSFDTSNVEDMGYMFHRCMRLINGIDLSSFNTSNVRNMEGMFSYCYFVPNLDLSSFDTSNVTNMRGMFHSCSYLTDLNISSFNTSNVTDMSVMFYDCEKLGSLDLSSFDTAKVESMNSMFSDCNSLLSLDLSNFNTSSVKNMRYMFYYCTSLKEVNVSNFNTENVTDMEYMFAYCSSLIELDLSDFNNKKVEKMNHMFARCESLETLNLTNFTTESVKTMWCMFGDCSSLRTLDLSSFDTRNVEKMHHMFNGCSSLEELNVTSFDTRNVNDMFSMFEECKSLTSLDLNSFNTSNVTDMSRMFQHCDSLKELDLNNFDTSKVTDMSGMFWYCGALEKLNITSFDTSNVKEMDNMFNYCTTLTELDLSHFNTSRVTDMEGMFQNCSSLVTLDLSNFNTANVDDMAYMFQNCGSLTTIYSEEWDTSKVTRDFNMFLGCEQVVGKSEYAITTPYDPNRIEKEVATPSNGYFTVPNLEEWNATVKLINEDNQVLATKDFLRTNRKPEITTENLNEFMPNGYELVNEDASLTVTQDGQVFEVEIRKIQWVLELEYQTVDGSIVKTEAIQVTQLNPVVTAQTISEKVPTGYELAEEVSDWTATANGEKKVIQVCEIQWTVSLEYQTADGDVIKTEAIQVTQLNPVVTAQTITDSVPTGYELADSATDWTATANGDKKVIQVRAIEWTVNLEYQTADGTVVKTEAIQVAQLNPVVIAQTITDKVPTGYELIDPASDWTATSNGDKKVIQVRAIEWTVNLEYQTADGTVVKTESIHVTQLNPVVPAQAITDKVPTGYELVDSVTDWTANSNGDKKVIQVREIEWIVNLEYQTVDGNIVKEEQIQVTQLNPVVRAQTITEKAPTGYELIDPASDWTATANGDKKVIQVREVEWTVNLEYQTADGDVIKTEEIQITQLNPVVTAQTITEKVPTGYELVDSVSDWTATANGEKKVIQVREVEWAVSLEYQTVDGTTVKTETLQVTQLNPTVSAQTITEKVPVGYELAEEVTDWTAAANGDKKVIQVREIEWTITIEFVTENSKGLVETVTFTVGNLNPVIEAQRITDAIPAGYYAPNEIQDLRATKDGEVFQVTVEKIESREGIVHFVDQNGVTIKTEVYKVTNKAAMIRVDELEKALPAGATLVKPLTELTVTKDKEEFIIEVIMPVEEEPNQPEIGGDDDTTTDAEQPGGSIEGVQTGDTTQAGLWASIMVGSIGILAYLKRKKKKFHI